MNLEKAVDHGEHSEHSGKAVNCDCFWIPLGGSEKLKHFAVFAVSPWFELRF